ncbi:aquaporin-like protein [Rhodotorula diobovata]|uniref:Aquaporin-like protein n=1 Tax=Rhodotorula diobovata TaxID=5288 RepID=A0A5C5FKG6_9BASI|nr:aquaporin-like protein [Rhodotorula diobovata]
MQAQRGHLDRANGDLEVGAADLLQQRPNAHHSAPVPSPPTWLVRWERKRPTLLMECLAEAIGVFFYVFSGVGATATFFVTSAAKEEGYGSLLTVGLAYAFGIAFAIIVAAPTSGGHLSPSFTVCFTIYKGFPLRKAPFYILSQLLGGFVAVLCAYGIFNQQFKEIYAALEVAAPAQIYSPSGPAGVLALFPAPGQELRWAFLNEFIANIFLSILVFSVLDLCNFFVSIPTAPFTIGLGYFVIIVGFSVNSVALNVARDIPGRFACAAIYGSKCFTASSGYTALAALTTFPASIIGAGIQQLFLSDSARMIVNAPPSMADHVSIANEQRGFSSATRALTRESVWRDNGSPVKQ